MDKYLIWLMHIPKTGGSSLFRTLCHGVPEEAIAPWHDRYLNQRAHKKQPLYVGEYHVMRAHYDYQLFDLLVGIPIRKVTVLRHPVNRVISMYNHFRLQGSQKQRRMVAGKSILEFCDTYEWRYPGNNLMTRMLAGCYEQDFGPPPYPDDTLTQALANLSTFDVYGAMEHWDTLIDKLEMAFDKTYPRHIKLNANHHADVYEPTNDERDAIIERNQMDMQVWTYALD